MDKVEEILPRITEYLKVELARENLSPLAERTRLYYVERIEATIEESRTSLGRRGSNSSTEPPYNSSTDGKSHKNKNYSAFERKSRTVNNYVVNEMPHSQIDKNFQAYDEVLIGTPGQQQLSSYQNEIGRPSYTNDSSTDYEDYSDSSESALNLYDQIGPALGGGSLDSRIVSRSHKRTSKRKGSSLSGESKTARSGVLYQKGILKMIPRHCTISGTWLVCFDNEKDLKPQLALDLSKYDITCLEKDLKNVYHEMRFSSPGREPHYFYSTDYEQLKEWEKDLKAASSAAPTASVTRSNSSPMTPQRNKPNSTSKTITEEMNDSFSSENISGGSIDKTSPKEDKLLAGFQAAVGNVMSKKLKTIKSTFGWKKSHKDKCSANDLFEASNIVISDYVFIATDTGGDGSSLRWFHRFCLVREARLEVYKKQNDEVSEFSVQLTGANLVLPDSHVKKQFVLKLSSQDREIYINTVDAAEHGRWLNALIKESGFGSRGTGVDHQQKPQQSKDGALLEELNLYDELVDPVKKGSVFNRVDDGEYLQPDSIRNVNTNLVNENSEIDFYANKCELSETSFSKEIEAKLGANNTSESPDTSNKSGLEDLQTCSNASDILSGKSTNSNRAKLTALGRLSQSDETLSTLLEEEEQQKSPEIKQDSDDCVKFPSAADLHVSSNQTTAQILKDGDAKDRTSLSAAGAAETSAGSVDSGTQPVSMKTKADDSYLVNKQKSSTLQANASETACIRSQFVKDRMKLFQGK